MNQSLTKIAQSVEAYWQQLLELTPKLAVALLVFIIGVLVARWIGALAHRKLDQNSSDPLMSKFLGKAVRFVLIIAVFMMALNIAGFGAIAGGILAAAGASAVIFGFAFKDIGQNFIAGVILAFNRPFNVNDTIKMGDIFGKVKTLEFRYTKIKSFDGKDIYIPNSDVLTKPVTNYTEDGFFRWDFMVGIAYEDNITGAKQVVLETLEAQEDVISDSEHENFVIEEELATSTVNLKVFFWVETEDFRRQALITKGNVVRVVKEALEENGYYLPADIQEIKLYGSEKKFPIVLIDERDEAEQ